MAREVMADWVLSENVAQLRDCNKFGGVLPPQIGFCDGEAYHATLDAVVQRVLDSKLPVTRLKELALACDPRKLRALMLELPEQVWQDAILPILDIVKDINHGPQAAKEDASIRAGYSVPTASPTT